MQGEGEITCEPTGYLTAFEVGLDSKWFVDPVWGRVHRQKKGTCVCLYVATLRCVNLCLAREERRVVETSFSQLTTGLGCLQIGLEQGWSSVGPCVGHQVDGGASRVPVLLLVAHGASSPDAALSLVEGENKLGEGWGDHSCDTSMHLTL